ncbi:MAG: hypothetical protein KI791_16910 [Cyclobacteriaceae bacterium]|nr:hypothetical protein [Cyclobacteriaceae bacterium SS2]
MRYVLFILVFGSLSHLKAQTKDTTFFDKTRQALQTTFGEKPTLKRDLFFEYLKNANEPSYITFIDNYKPTTTLTPSLRAEDGKDIVIEGHLAPSYYIIKPQSNKLGMALSFQGAFTLRLVKDESSPMIPPSNKAGFRFDYLMGTDGIFTTFFTSELMHYSNGGSPGSIDSLLLDTQGILRNDYVKGDFSTNYLRLGQTLIFNTRYFGQKNYLHAYLYYQRDMHINDLLNYFPIQEGRYGYHRIGTSLVLSSTWLGLFSKKEHFATLRYEPTIILDKAEILGETGTSNRMANKLQIIISAPVLGETGIFTQFYWGRDYLNIRYDLPVFYWSFGAAFNSMPEFTQLIKAR